MEMNTINGSAETEQYEAPPGPPPSRIVPLNPTELPLILPVHQPHLATQGWTTVTYSDDVQGQALRSSIQALFLASKAFFTQPEEYKLEFATRLGSEEGWSSIPGEKEFITLRSLGRTPKELREPAMEAWGRFGSLLNSILEGIEDSLALQRKSLTKFSEPCLKLDGTRRATMLRLFRYEGWEDKIVAEPHKDLGLLSLVAGDSPGLEVWNEVGKSWFPIEATYPNSAASAATLLGGRQLQRFTNERYLPGGHQVRSYPRNTFHPADAANDESPKYRYSIVFVLRAHNDVIVNTDTLTSHITGEHRNPIKDQPARKLFDHIRKIHYNINTGMKDRKKQKMEILEAKGKLSKASQVGDGASKEGPTDGAEPVEENLGKG